MSFVCTVTKKLVEKLKSRNDAKHDGKELNYKSAVSRNISSCSACL